MKRIPSFLLAFLLLAISTAGSAACPEGQEENDRTGECVSKQGSLGGSKSIDQENREIIEVVSSNPFNFFSLMNNPTEGGTVTIKAKLEFSSTAGKTEKIPAMVFVHGSGGPKPRHQKWLKLFREMGFATVYANHFTPRGVSSTVGNQSRVSYAMMAADALHLLNALAKHPRIDPNRIGIMGGSKGGGVAVYVTWNPLREVIAKDNQYAASIPLYPPCFFWEKKDFTNKPMLMMIGDKDNYTGVDQCVSSMKEIRSAGYSNMQVKLYKGAYHAFDSDKRVRRMNEGYNLTKCKFAVRADGMLYERTTGIPMDTANNMKKVIGICATKGVTLGGSRVMPQAMQDVREFLTTALASAKNAASESTASTSDSDLIWCGHKQEVTRVDKYSCEWRKGGKVFDTQSEATAFHNRLKGGPTSTASTTPTTSTSTVKAEAPLSKEPLAVPTTPGYLVVDVQTFLKGNSTLPELVVVMQQTLALKAAIKREDQVRIEDRYDQLVEIMAEIEGFTAFQQARAKQRQAGAAILKQGKAVALELRQYLVEHMENDNIGQLLTTLASLEAALGQGDIETVQRLIDTASTAINATATPNN